MDFSAVIVAAGAGVRAGGGKQWRSLGGKPVLRWSAEALLDAGARKLVVVAPAGEEARAEAALEGLSGWEIATGGATRAESTRAGLALLSDEEDGPAVLVHDAARPFAQHAPLPALLAALASAEGAIPALAVSETLKRQAEDQVVTVDRQGLYAAQTPQAFRLATLRAALAAWPETAAPTDDAAAIERAGGRVTLVGGHPMLFKLTWPEDLEMAERVAEGASETRIGQGYDVHAFAPGDAVTLCGVRIPHNQTLAGHSDADAGLHAVTDAILGALGAGDIGEHFPSSDPRWKGAASDVFLRHAAALAAQRQARIVNVDLTLICEAPKLGAHRQAMRERLAEVLAIPVDRVSIKATTTDRLGFAGRREGLAAQAVVALQLPVEI